MLKDVVSALAEHSGNSAESICRICAKDRNDGLPKPTLDLQILADLVAAVSNGQAPSSPEYGPDSVPQEILDVIERLPGRPPVVLSYEVVNTDRIIGTRLSGRIAEIHGDRGLSANSIHITCHGSAGLSFGCFLVAGVKIELIGEANDYVGNGIVAVLGKTGKNFGAGMSGSTAYVQEADGKFFSRVNSEMLVALPIKRTQDIAEIRALIELHLEKTGSVQATKLLSNWEKTTFKLVFVSAQEYAALEAAEELHDAASTPVGAK